MGNEQKLIAKALQFQQGGDVSAAERVYRKLLKRDRYHLDANYLLGTLYAEAGRFQDAVKLLTVATEAAPNSQFVLNNLGNVYLKLRRDAKAGLCFEKALAIDPDMLQAMNNLANVRMREKRYSEANELFDRLLQKNPDFAPAHLNLGGMYLRDRKISRAIHHNNRALVLDPSLAGGAHHNLGSCYLGLGDTTLALEHLQKAQELKGADCQIGSDILMAHIYDDEMSPDQIYEAHKEWATRHRLESPNAPSETKAHDSNRMLRIGYVSPDFRIHPVGCLIEPVLRNHDKDRFSVYVYSDVQEEDELTAKCRSYGHAWRSIIGQSDEVVAELVKSDAIDILIDLSGHTANNRLAMFMRRPSPVQVSYLGYPATTGLDDMDYIISDAVLDPIGRSESNYTEQIWRLDGVWSCFSGYESSPAVTAAPFKQNGYITFGSFNAFSKINSTVIGVWCELLEKVPTAKLIIQSAGLSAEDATTWVEERFVSSGIDGTRIQVYGHMPWQEHLALYNQVDITLDVFPWCGHMTTLNSLWMGVPVMTLAGDRRSQRMSASLLHRLEMADLIAESEEQYIAQVISLIQDEVTLSCLRSELRHRMQSSEIMATEKHTKNMETAFVAMWHELIQEKT